MVDRAGALDAELLRGLVVGVPRAALVAADFPDRVAVRVERERLLEEGAARAWIGVRAHAVEALECELARDLGMVRDKRLVTRLDDGELEVEALRVGEAEAALAAVDRDPFAGQAIVPELDRVLGRDPEDDPVHHAAAGTAGTGVRVLEEGEVAAGAALLVRVEQVVDGRIVLVDGLLHEAQPEDAHIEVDVAGGVARDAGDVVNALEAHAGSTLPAPS